MSISVTDFNDFSITSFRFHVFCNVNVAQPKNKTQRHAMMMVATAVP
jgi:hypothetical protein